MLAGDAVRISRSVELLVMTPHDFGDPSQVLGPRDVDQEVVGVDDVRLDLPPFAGVERSAFDLQEMELVRGDVRLLVPFRVDEGRLRDFLEDLSSVLVEDARDVGVLDRSPVLLDRGEIRLEFGFDRLEFGRGAVRAFLCDCRRRLSASDRGARTTTASLRRPLRGAGLARTSSVPTRSAGILLLCIHRIVDEKVRIAHEVYDAGFEPGIDVVHVSVELVVRDEADHMAVDPYAIPDHEGRVADAHYVQREVAQLVASLVEMLELHGRGDDAEWDGEIDRAHLSGEQILDVDVLSALGR